MDIKTIEYLSGKITEVELLKTASTQADRTYVHFVVGCFNLAKKKSAAAKQHLTWVVKNGDKRMDEYLISLCEMNHKRFIYL